MGRKANETKPLGKILLGNEQVKRRRDKYITSYMDSFHVPITAPCFENSKQ